ncbi:GNAT family N-acetyltransferase [Frigoribacterium sp. CFBP 8751]|uniref:GNAT family N-acetyltransferase n=1 Tax=Frigoribacterium sp. CFBP 8751 TaxID=2775277 RepID=UPI0017843A0D|nr:GNAT family N-acetyltransferase [Frigoribacterium sp. CFBP 8751]
MIETTDGLIPLVDRWVEGWALSRGAARHRDGDAWQVDVAAATRAVERIVARPTPAELTRLVDETTTSDVWLSVVGPLDGVAHETLARLEAVTHAERMMTAPVSATLLPADVILDGDGDGDDQVVHVRVEVDGVVAARGQAAVVGEHVVFDRIATEPDFRRRGLGRRVMAGLEHGAAARGATTGLLFASVDGRRLYESLGWREVAELGTWRGRGLPG